MMDVALGVVLGAMAVLAALTLYGMRIGHTGQARGDADRTHPHVPIRGDE